MVDRPSDVRVILRTSDLQGKVNSIANHGHPDNELSEVAHDGKNAYMVMPNGDTPRRQLFAAQQIRQAIEQEGLTTVTPEFIQKHIANPAGKLRKFVGQIYGPAPFEAQAERLVDTDIPRVDGNGVEVMHPLNNGSVAIGMRAPTKEEAFIVVYAGKGPDMFVTGGEAAATILSTLEGEVSAKLKGTNTTLEQLDGLGVLTKAIVLSVDAATGNTKPIRLETAADIFDLSKMNIVLVKADGTLSMQLRNIATEQPPAAETSSAPTIEPSGV
ncbi:MAG: hypothetical protein LRY76_04820 [Alphaproteobacteria bacterium]|nr:hypothetical protein [Alphaproteobacteria bacterium]